MLYHFLLTISDTEKMKSIFINEKLCSVLLEDPGVDGRIILNGTCERLDGGGHGLDQSGSV
jgi:hypothetical protein